MVIWGLKGGEGGKKTYATMGTIGATALLGRLVDLDVLDDQVARVEAFGVRVGLGVFEQTQEELSRFDGPTCARDTELLSCTGKRMSAFRHNAFHVVSYSRPQCIHFCLRLPV